MVPEKLSGRDFQGEGLPGGSSKGGLNGSGSMEGIYVGFAGSFLMEGLDGSASMEGLDGDPAGGFSTGLAFMEALPREALMEAAR